MKSPQQYSVVGVCPDNSHILVTDELTLSEAEDAKLTLSDSGLFAAIINRIARQELCQPDRFGKMTEAELDKEINRIVAWSKENAR